MHLDCGVRVAGRGLGELFELAQPQAEVRERLQARLDAVELARGDDRANVLDLLAKISRRRQQPLEVLKHRSNGSRLSAQRCPSLLSMVLTMSPTSLNRSISPVRKVRPNAPSISVISRRWLRLSHSSTSWAVVFSVM